MSLNYKPLNTLRGNNSRTGLYHSSSCHSTIDVFLDPGICILIHDGLGTRGFFVYFVCVKFMFGMILCVILNNVTTVCDFLPLLSFSARISLFTEDNKNLHLISLVGVFEASLSGSPLSFTCTLLRCQAARKCTANAPQRLDMLNIHTRSVGLCDKTLCDLPHRPLPSSSHRRCYLTGR
jgi:hypothetical protein